MPKPPSNDPAIELALSKWCLTADCRLDRAAGCKGLCMKCYSRAKKMVAGGSTTWDELAALGMVESEKDAFETEFLKRKSGS